MARDLRERQHVAYRSEAFRSREIDGIPVKCIASNIRPPVDWSSMNVAPGIGHEGNLVVVEVASDKGSTMHVENSFGRDERMHKGDIFVGVLANRYSGTSESGGVPPQGLVINPDHELNLLSTAGVVGKIEAIPPGKFPKALDLKPLGLVSQQGKPVTLEDLCGSWHETLQPSSPIVVVTGTSAEVGKTTTSSALIRALKAEGIRVAGTKFAGTGRMRDILSMRDAGAHPWLDFPDVGLATTYTSPDRFTRAICTLFNYINTGSPDIIIAEAGRRSD